MHPDQGQANTEIDSEQGVAPYAAQGAASGER